MILICENEKKKFCFIFAILYLVYVSSQNLYEEIKIQKIRPYYFNKSKFTDTRKVHTS